ncbi:esterase E4-like [Epargyreus clarus]|uniref:esterase E4-like n=1 Tax=Epargyreus clarus TaxID=520877 RepID=UPI003C2E5BBE
MIYVNIRRIVYKVQSSLENSCRLLCEMRNPIVTIKQGKLRGSVDKLHDGTPYYSFKGVPYAQPPIGPLRFKAPLPPNPWSGVYDALEHGPICPQVEMHTMQIADGNENCLFLNVYTKSLQPDSKLPVMVYVHGGAYMSGSGDSMMYGPKFLLQHDVILVTINYRLEVLGFLCLDTPEVPGNAGMKDQVAAFRWVQNNISQFGGDPRNVTIFGESAGASSVNLHMFSPMSKGLFHKVIAQSGIAISDWALGKNAKERAIRAGKYLGANTEDPGELTEFFKKVPASKLVSLTTKTLTKDEKHRGLTIHFAPVVEKKFGNTEVFLEDDPLKLLIEGKVNKVPIIAGYNSAEGLMITKIQIKKLDFYNKNPLYLVPREIALTLSEEKMKDFGETIKKYYIGNKDFTPNDINEYSAMLTDAHFMYNTQRFLHLYSMLYKSVFMYRFDCVTELNLFKQLLNYSAYEGACHVDELFYIFSNMMNDNAYKENERLREIVYKITKMWTDFAKTSNPTPDNSVGVTWSPYSTASKEYLSIGEQLSVQKYADKDRAEFWNKLYGEAGRPHIVKSNL